MKLETKINKILLSNNSKNLKKVQLFNLAFKLFPGSNEQKKVQNLINNL